IIVMVAAVGDYRVSNPADSKIKKSGAGLVLELQENRDILKEVGSRKDRQVVVGFAAETDDLVKNARAKLLKKNVEILVANMVAGKGSAFGADTNQAHLFFKDGREEQLPRMSKAELADIILDRAKEFLPDL
ncbi:MAG: bifunctional 4'-phosphopantothenoylcysteine decarboxylase/phosphopantothenoylcysteine synthetase, partial [Deltaproteobacteria bacterium]